MQSNQTKNQSKRSAKNVYAFIDSQNLNVTVQNLGWKMDWAKFRVFLAETYGATKAFMFIGYVPEFEAMYQQMHDAGYSVVLKPTFDMTRPRADNLETSSEPTTDHKKPHTSGQGDEDKKPVKGNIDADLVLWAMKEINTYDKAVIVSGDGDFYCLVEYLAEQNKLLRLLTPSGHYSRLYNAYEQYIDRIDTHRRQLAYKDYKRRPRKNTA